LVYLSYTYHYRSQFDEPNDDWLEAIEVTSDELLGTYTKVEDEAMSIFFGARGKRSLNRVFDVTGFIYLDYCFPAWKQGAKRKIATLTSSGGPKSKKVKVLTHRSKLRSLEKTVAAPAFEKMEIEYAEATPSTSKIIPVATAEATIGPTKEIEAKNSKTEERSKLQSPPTTTGLTKLVIALVATPRKGRRMARVLDDVLKSLKMPTHVSTEAPEYKIEDLREVTAASASPIYVETRPSGTKPVELAKESLPKKQTSTIPEAPSQDDLEYVVHHASGKQLSKEQIAEVQHYAKDLKYPRGSLVYEGNDEDDFLYCLPDSKEINFCQEMMDNMGYPKLELGLSAMTKDQLADNLAYNSLKVHIFLFLHLVIFVRQACGERFVVILIIIICMFFIYQGLILSKALKAQKDVEDESTQIAFGNLRSKVITLRNEALEKNKIMLSLVERLKSSESRVSSLSKAEPKMKEFEKKKEKDAKRIVNLEYALSI
jgi:hypothetical protein